MPGIQARAPRFCLIYPPQPQALGDGAVVASIYLFATSAGRS